MRIFFADEKLIALLRQKEPTKGISVGLLRSYQKVISIIKSAKDQRDIRAIGGLHLEKMKGYRDGRFSIRLTDKWRLILYFESDEDGNYVAVIELNNHYGD